MAATLRRRRLGHAISSTAQNSGSNAMEVAWPDSWTERFLKVAMA